MKHFDVFMHAGIGKSEGLSGSGVLNLRVWRFFVWLVGRDGGSVGGYLRVLEYICGIFNIFASFGIYLRVLEYICDFAEFICEFSLLFATRGWRNWRS